MAIKIAKQSCPESVKVKTPIKPNTTKTSLLITLLPEAVKHPKYGSLAASAPNITRSRFHNLNPQRKGIS